MNNPTGFRLDADGRVVDADPWAAMFGPSTLAAGRAHAARRLHGHRLHGRLGLRGRDAARPPRPLPPVRPADPADLRRDRRRPSRSGSATGSPTPSPRTSRPSWPRWRGCTRPGRGAPLSLGGIYYDDELHYAIEIPWGLSLLVHHDPDGVVTGPARSVPADQRPPVNVVHLAYNAMVGIGSALLLLALVFGLDLVAATPDPEVAVVPARRRRSPAWRRWSPWRPAGSPPRSAASRGSSTASCAPRTP